MFSPLENDSVDNWFQRLNAPLKRLPAEERTQLHQEVRQHLDALAAANEELGSSPSEASELALKQFGDPSKFGKQMAQEWRLGKTGLLSDIGAILFGCGLQLFTLRCLVFVYLLWSAVFVNPGNKVYHHGQVTATVASLVSSILLYGSAAITAAITGRKYPFQAIKSAFYAAVALDIGLFIWASGNSPNQEGDNSWLLSVTVILMTQVVQMITAYLASVTNRGWYRPTWDDFKLTLPKRRRQTG